MINKLIYTLILVLLLLPANASDTLTKIPKLRGDEFLISLSYGSYLFGYYHSVGYSRSYQLEGNSYIGFYAGLGYLPPKSEQLFADELGFKGDKLYAYSTRLQFVQKLKKIDLFTAFEYNYLKSSIPSYIGRERHYMGKLGVEFYLFKKHLSFTPQVGAGFARLNIPGITDKTTRRNLSVGFDIGYCF
jgi:hypothetical protein